MLNLAMGLPMENDIQPRCLKTDPKGCFFLVKHSSYCYEERNWKRTQRWAKHIEIKNETVF